MVRKVFVKKREENANVNSRVIQEMRTDNGHVDDDVMQKIWIIVRDVRNQPHLRYISMLPIYINAAKQYRRVLGYYMQCVRIFLLSKLFINQLLFVKNHAQLFLFI